MNSSFKEHEKIAIQVAKELERDGYSIILTPTPECIPFSLEGYNPDILATKGEEHLIIEIKSREFPEDAKRFRKVVEIVEKHPGWRFLIKTFAGRSSEQERVATAPIPLSLIEQYLNRADGIISAGSGELSIPYLWNAVVALLRNKAEGCGIATDLSDRSLINQLYSMGVISSSEHDNLMQWNQLRNSAVHVIPFEADSKSILSLSNYAKSLIHDLKMEKQNA
jgi:hypothetical protein